MTSCVHRWLIEPPGARLSKGVCSECGEERMFRNSFDVKYSSWASGQVTQTRADLEEMRRRIKS